jgi:hypothetical protein
VAAVTREQRDAEVASNALICWERTARRCAGARAAAEVQLSATATK